MLTPLAVDPAHPFPYISGLSLNLAVMVRDPDTRHRPLRAGEGAQQRAAVRPGRPRPTTTATFLPLEDLIAAHLPQLFPGLEVVSHHLFRVTRNADLEVEEDRDEDLLQALERELARRRFGPAVRLEVTDDDGPADPRGPADARWRSTRTTSCRCPACSTSRRCGRSTTSTARSSRTSRSCRPPTRGCPTARRPKSVFATLREGDVLRAPPLPLVRDQRAALHRAGGRRPEVLAIKQTLYRTSGDSPIVNALIDAAEAGKQVVVLVEIKARFDEEANITWARSLERAGCHVVYGLVGLKTHCKTALVVRREHGVLRRYCHIGTGNYNPKTARLYEDLGILTADPRVGADLTDLFNTLTGYSPADQLPHAAWSPRTASAPG